MFVDHYSVLQLPSGLEGAKLTQVDICRAYKRMALRLHPDKNLEDPTAHVKFQNLQASYEILTDPVTRKQWDRILEFWYDNPREEERASNKRQRGEQNQQQRQREDQASNKRQRGEQSQKEQEQRYREQEQRQREQEQRHREQEQRQREQEQRQREQEQRQREQEQRQREQEQRQREQRQRQRKEQEERQRKEQLHKLVINEGFHHIRLNR